MSATAPRNAYEPVRKYTGNLSLENLAIVVLALIVAGRSIALLRDGTPWAFMTISSLGALGLAIVVYMLSGTRAYTVALLAASLLMVVTDVGVGDYVGIRKAVAWIVQAMSLMAFVVVVYYRVMEPDPSNRKLVNGTSLQYRLVEYTNNKSQRQTGCIMGETPNRAQYLMAKSCDSGGNALFTVSKNKVIAPRV